MAEKVTRGSWQRRVWENMRIEPYNPLRWDLYGTENPLKTLAGRAGSYSSHYQESLLSLIERAHRAGYIVLWRPGPRGGTWSSRLFAVKRVKVATWGALLRNGWHRFTCDYCPSECLARRAQYSTFVFCPAYILYQ